MKLAILFDCHTFDVGAQGTSTFLAGLINALPSVASTEYPDLDLRIVCASHDKSAVQDSIQIRHEYARIPKGFLQRNLVSIPRIASASNIDIVVSQYVRPIWVPKLSATIVHDLLFLDFPEQFGFAYRWSRKALFRLAARRSSVLFTISEYSRDRIATRCNIRPSQITVLPIGIQEGLAREPARHAGKSGASPLRLLYVARLEKRKRHRWCLKAVNQLVAEGYDVRLTLVGSGRGSFAEELRRDIECAARGCAGRVVYREDITVEALEQEYAAADVFLFPSLAEGFGIPVIEAAAFGLPCVVSAGSALSELRPDYVGVEFDRDSFAGFVDGIKAVLTALPSYRAAAANNRHRVTSRRSWNTAARRFIAGVAEAAGCL